MVPSEKHLTANMTPSQDVTLLGVNEELHSLAPELKDRKPEAVAKALKLVGQYANLVNPEFDNFEKYKKLEMTIDLKDFWEPAVPVELGDSVAFIGGNVNKNIPMYVVLTQPGRSPVASNKYHSIEGNLSNIHGFPAYRVVHKDGSASIFDWVEELPHIDQYIKTEKPINFNGKIAFPAQKKDRSWVIVINGEEEFVSPDVKNIIRINEINGKLLIYSQDSDGRSLIIYDGKKVGGLEKYQITSNFFGLDGELACYAKKRDFQQWLLVIGGREVPFESTIRGDTVFEAEEINGKDSAMIYWNGGRNIIYDGKLLDYLLHHADIRSPIFMNQECGVIFPAEEQKGWSLFNEKKQSMTVDFDKIYSLRRLDDQYCLILGLKGNTYVRQLVDVSEGWESRE